MQKYILSLEYVILILLLLSSCKKEPYTDTQIFEKVLKSETIDKKELLKRIKVNNTLVEQILPNKKIKVVAISYNTTNNNGEDILASGLIIYPAVNSALNESGSIIGLHYTIGADYQAPSMALAAHEALFALFGYVVIMPDYFGYGLTKDLPHPYLHYQSTGRAAADMYFAAQEYFGIINRRFPKETSILGYSQGGYSSLATQKYLEENYPNWVKIKQVFAGAGAYDLEASYTEFVKTNLSTQPVTIPMLVIGLDSGDNLNLDYTQLFREPLLSKYKEWILSKKYTTDQVSDMIGTNVIDKIFAPQVYDVNNVNTKKFLQSLKDNSVVDWIPKAKLVLLHGTDDTIVPFVNTESAYKSFKNKGCDISLVKINGKDHKPAGNDFYLYCLKKLVLPVQSSYPNANLINNITDPQIFNYE